MRLLVLMVCAGALAAPAAAARSLQIQGVTGYLSEYELSANVSGADGAADELSGPLNVKHVGLCTHGGPDEISGQLKIQFVGLSHEVAATLIYEGRECAFRGILSESTTGSMTCTNKLTLPLRLWAK